MLAAVEQADSKAAERIVVEEQKVVEEQTIVAERIAVERRTAGQHLAFDCFAVVELELLGCKMEDCSRYLQRQFPLELPIVIFLLIRLRRTTLEFGWFNSMLVCCH